MEPRPAGRRQEQSGVGRDHGHLSFQWVLLSYFQSYQGRICTGQRPGSTEQLVVTVTHSALAPTPHSISPAGRVSICPLGCFCSPSGPGHRRRGVGASCPSGCGRRAWQAWRAGEKGTGPLCRAVLPAGLCLTRLSPPGSLAPQPHERNGFVLGSETLFTPLGSVLHYRP